MTRHLVHVGFPKAGSTYLQHWFERHPQLRYAEGGIAGFHDPFHIARQATAPATPALWAVTSYEGFTAPRPSAGSVDHDYAPLAVPMLEAQEEACRLLAALFPGAHVLIVTRGFRSMILSSYSQYVRSGGTGDLAHLFGASTDDLPWRYDQVIGAYRRNFGADNVIVLPYELLKRDPVQFFVELDRRLGTDPQPLLGERVNRSLSGAEMRWYPRLTRTVDRLPLPGRLRRAARRAYVARAMDNRLQRPIRLLQRLRPLEPVAASSIPQHVLDRFRGQASLLAEDPVFAPYADDYLF